MAVAASRAQRRHSESRPQIGVNLSGTRAAATLGPTPNHAA